MITFGLKPIGDVTKADIEAIRDARRRAGPEAILAGRQWEAEAAEREQKGQTMDPRKPRLLAGSKGGEVGVNRLLERLRALVFWAIVEGYIESTPFKRGGQVLQNSRTRSRVIAASPTRATDGGRARRSAS